MANISAGTTAQIIPYSPENGLFLQNLGSAAVYVDFNAAVTDSSGVQIPTNGTLTIARQLDQDGGPLYIISGSAAQDVRYLEV